MMMSLLWFYRPEHTDIGRQPGDCDDEVFASKHRDFTSVACIEDKCFVMTFNEYCRYELGQTRTRRMVQLMIFMITDTSDFPACWTREWLHLGILFLNARTTIPEPSFFPNVRWLMTECFCVEKFTILADVECIKIRIKQQLGQIIFLCYSRKCLFMN